MLNVTFQIVFGCTKELLYCKTVGHYYAASLLNCFITNYRYLVG